MFLRFKSLSLILHILKKLTTQTKKVTITKIEAKSPRGEEVSRSSLTSIGTQYNDCTTLQWSEKPGQNHYFPAFFKSSRDSQNVLRGNHNRVVNITTKRVFLLALDFIRKFNYLKLYIT